MAYFMTLGNVYYEAEIKANEVDISVPARPSAAHDWDYQSGAWVAAVIPYSADAIKTHRDQRIETKVLIHNAKKAVCDTRTRLSLNNTISYLQAANEDITINWKGPDGYYDLSLSDVQGLIKVGGAWVQKCFDAEKHVIDTHAVTPYTTHAAAVAAFNAFLEA